MALALRTSDLIVQYCDQRVSTAEIARKTGLSQASVKNRLIRHLGKKKYMKIAHSIGGRTVARRLHADSVYRERYSRKISAAVGQALNERMKSEAFRTAWKKKARAESQKGTRNLLQRMGDSDFQNEWLDKCRQGGNAAYGKAVGIYAKENAAKRTRWSIRGLLNSGRKISGPKGERMYNDLEKQVAKILTVAKVQYEYEKRFRTSGLNGFCSVDFQVTGNRFIEVTYWDDARKKSAKLNQKYRMLREMIQARIEFIVVTKPNRIDEYRQHLEKDIRVLGPKQLTAFLAKIAG